MKLLLMVILLVTLSACGQQTLVLSTETSIPTVVSATLVPTATLIPVTVTPSPLPTQPIISMITPDPIQVERWKEYQTALGEIILREVEPVLCEWEILERTDQEVYVWAVCMSIFSVVSTGLPYHAERPAVILVGKDGTVQSVEIPGIHYGPDIMRMFPPDAEEKYFQGLIHFQELTDHLNWRREQPEELPLIVLSSTSTLIPVLVTPLATQPTIPILTPHAIQVERWKEYEDELAKLVLANHSSQEFPFYESALCEWDILGRSGQDIYVWAECAAPGSGGRGPAVIYLEEDGSIRDVIYAFPSPSRDVTISRLFPEDIQAKIYTYFSSERSQEMGRHLMYRLTHPEEPPLIVLNATPTP